MRSDLLRASSPLCAAAASLVLCLAPAALAARKVTIADLAPPASVFVAGVDDAAAMKAAFDRTGLKSLWEDPQIQNWVKESMKDSLPEIDQTLEALGLTRDDLTAPTGATGLAAWFVTGQDNASELAVLILADYGEGAGELHDKLVEALERAERQNKITLRDDERDGLEFWSCAAVEPEAAAEEEEEDDWGWEPEPSTIDLLVGEDSLKEMHYARIDQYLILASHLDALMDAHERISGEDRPSVRDNAEFNASRRQTGNMPGYAVLLMRNGREALIKVVARQDPEQAEEMAQITKVLDVLGLSAVEAVGAGLRFDTDAGIVEQSYGALVPRKEGLLALLNPAPAPFTPPTFAGADASQFTMFQFDFSGLIPLINRVIATLPEQQRAEAGGMVMMATATAGPVLANIGPEVYITQTIERPFSHSSQKIAVAMRVKDAGALEQTIAGQAPMLGLESRDFIGNRIWSPAQGGFIPADAVAMGIGAGFVFIGPAPSVENAMRQVAGGEAARLADDPAFRHAVRPLAAQGLGFSYASFRQAMEYFEWTARNMDRIIEERFNEMFAGMGGMDKEQQEWRDEMVREAKAEVPAWTRTFPGAAPFLRHIGDLSAEWRATDDGFVGRVITLPPRQ